MDKSTLIIILIVVLVILYIWFKQEKFSMIDSSIIRGSLLDNQNAIKQWYRT